MTGQGDNRENIEQSRHHCKIDGCGCDNPFTEGTQAKSQPDNPHIAAERSLNKDPTITNDWKSGAEEAIKNQKGDNRCNHRINNQCDGQLVAKIGLDQFDKQQARESNFENQIGTESGKFITDPANPFKQNSQAENTKDRRSNGCGED